MVKRRNLSTRAFGAEPGIPDVAVLAAWIADHRGTPADIITYLLDQSLAPQLAAGITLTLCRRQVLQEPYYGMSRRC